MAASDFPFFCLDGINEVADELSFLFRLGDRVSWPNIGFHGSVRDDDGENEVSE